MTDGAFPNRLAQLETRWESDPTSRIFLQLAEEYRHQGRIKEALSVLDRGLQEHPGYLSALVAKGRCHLELGEGEPARSVLERVVKQDATQMVANKLLVRAYLETGEPERARERLDLYSLLNDSDPEIGDLRRQIRMMDRAKEQAFEDSHPTSRPDDVFDLDDLGGRGPFHPEVEDVFPLSEAAAVETPVEELVEELVDEEGDGDLFPGLVSRASRELYLAGLVAEGIFEVGLAPPAPIPEKLRAEPTLPEVPEPFPEPKFEPPVISAEPAVEEESWLEDIPPAAPPTEPSVEAPPAQAFAPLAPAEVAVEGPAELWPEEEEIPPLPELEAAAVEAPVRAGGPVATATLGELYLRQGHLEEAERMFREVLAREPESSAARAGLGRLLEIQPQPAAATLQARDLLAGFRSGAGGGTTARKIFLLTRYLDRLRGSRNVP